jgi:hypothetical protein
LPAEGMRMDVRDVGMAGGAWIAVLIARSVVVAD